MSADNVARRILPYPRSPIPLQGYALLLSYRQWCWWLVSLQDKRDVQANKYVLLPGWCLARVAVFVQATALKKMLPIDLQSIDSILKKPDNVLEEMERRSSASTEQSRKADHLCVLVHG